MAANAGLRSQQIQPRKIHAQIPPIFGDVFNLQDKDDADKMVETPRFEKERNSSKSTAGTYSSGNVTHTSPLVNSKKLTARNRRANNF